MYGYGSLIKRILYLFDWFRSYSKIASKGGAGGLKYTVVNIRNRRDRFSMLSSHVIHMLRGSLGILYGHYLSHYWECGGEKKIWYLDSSNIWVNINTHVLNNGHKNRLYGGCFQYLDTLAIKKKSFLTPSQIKLEFPIQNNIHLLK